MKAPDQHHCIDDDKFASDIEKYGWIVLMIPASDYLPSFAYTVGLLKHFNHPELICFGMKEQVANQILNDAGELIRKGEVIKTETNYDLFENSRAEFIKVDKRSIGDYFGYAISYYKTAELPALQLVWTDRNNRFPWEDGFEEVFRYKQPLLDRNANFKFREPANLCVFTSRQHLEEDKPILYVVHEHDGDWQFITGDQVTTEDGRVVSLERMVLRDNTLNEVFDLEYGEEAERDVVGGKWRRSRFESVDD
ncbi:DUF4262 domain-containing protein [Pedobacter sp. SYSU D00535]|uniref:DUF4262 domain-containing protein n=1 Tax=Pedobacter sp. SYSU D00535 TaxID=2810308 RepID=UPI001A969B9D|nr:DUF4262 domain-containing protein [Pedobacter sp. SYSU D00535]